MSRDVRIKTNGKKYDFNSLPRDFMPMKRFSTMSIRPTPCFPLRERRRGSGTFMHSFYLRVLKNILVSTLAVFIHSARLQAVKFGHRRTFTQHRSGMRRHPVASAWMCLPARWSPSQELLQQKSTDVLKDTKRTEKLKSVVLIMTNNCSPNKQK